LSTDALGRAALLELLEAHQIAPSRALGQNFVVDPNTIERIVRLSGARSGAPVLEIGAGLGSLSRGLVRSGCHLTALEIDRRLVPVLRATLPEQVRVVEGDAMRDDLSALLAESARLDPPDPGVAGDGVLVVANLPYNIATPLVMRILEEVPEVTRLFVMVQLEVGERLAALPGNKAWGAVSALLTYFATARVVGRVSPQVFHPRPHVDSALVEIVRLDEPAVPAEVAGYAAIQRVVHAGFATRRKMLRSALSGLVGEACFEEAEVASTRRAEELTITEWGRLARCAS
jgi:16S rRNA (adenine1518-N6/adenine1519-N6)-dimethyltransferase